jgi:hypothetical protein
VPRKFKFDSSLFGRGPSSKGGGFALWFSSNKIVLFHWALDLEPSFEMTLILNCKWKSQNPKYVVV